MPAIGIRPWTPDKIPMVAWYDASDASTITESDGAVSQWDDKSGNANHVTQDNGTKQPITGTRTLNGKNVLDFDGIDDLIQNPALAGLGTTDKAIMMVVQSDALENTRPVQMFAGAGAGQMFFYNNGASAYVATDGIKTFNLSQDTDPHIIAMGKDVNGDAFFNRDGSTPATQASGPGLYPASMNIGHGTFDGRIAEVIYLDVPDTTTRQRLEGYLAHKWGLTANLPEDHPYRYRPPVDSSLDTEDWDPTSIATAAWYDASEASTITESGGEVSQLDDKSGNNRHMAQATPADRPTTGTVKINGKNVLDFNSDYMIAPRGADYTGDKVAVFGVFERDNVVGNASTFVVLDTALNRDYNTVNSAVMAWEDDGSVLKAYRNSAELSSLVHPGNDIAYQLGSVFDGTNQISYLNGADATPAASAGNFSYDSYLLCARREGGAYVNKYDGKVGEVIVIEGEVSTETRQKIEGYLAHKWGLTANLTFNHPYKTKKPQRTKLWTPNDIATEAWYDAADASTIDDGTVAGQVDQWDDKSGNARHGTQAVPTSKPAYEAAGFNGRPTINFGSGDNLAITMPAGTLKAFVVTKPTPTANLTVIQNIGSNTFIPFAVDGSGSSNVFRVDSSNDPVGLEMYVNGNTTPVNRTQNDMYDALITNNPGGVLVNLGDIPVGTGTTLARIGDDSSGWNAVGRVCELIYVDATIAVADVQKLEGYLAWKWGFPHQLPDTHPYKRRPPMI